MFFRFSLLSALLACTTYAIQVKSSYGPPHREYGVPQKIPFREYGPPASKYGPPKLNFIGGGGSSSGLHEQIKNYYGAPKPFYGPPHKMQQQYGPPLQQFGPPPSKLQEPPASYGPPPPKALPLFQPAYQFNPGHQPASSYGPPPSGPLSIPPKQIFGTPPPNYGPPPLPNFNEKPDTTIILTAGQNPHPQQQQKVNIQFDATGNSHSVAGSQAPFHTACDGWKPIPSPAGSYVENNLIETQAGYSQVAQAQTHALQSSSISSTSGATGSGSNLLIGGSGTKSNNIINGLSDEQLVAVALQSNTFDVDNSVQQQDILLTTGPAGDFHKHNLNPIEAEALQLSLSSIDDTYSKPPADSFTPGSRYSNKQSSSHSSFQGSFGIIGPDGSFGPPPPPNGEYRPPPQSKGYYRPPHTASPPPPPKSNFGSPPPPNGNYKTPLTGPQTGNYRPLPSSGPGGPTFVHHKAQANLGIQYGKQSGNLGMFQQHSSAQPSKPVTYRPPVPPGLFETIGATVQHLDKFGVKPQLQAPTYIPPAANEIPQTGPGYLNIQYGVPYQLQQQGIPQNIIEQQLPQPRPPQVFVQIEHQQINHQQQQFENAHAEFSVPALPPLIQQGPLQYLPPVPLAQSHQKYLPPTGTQQQHQKSNGGASYTASATTTFDDTAFASNQFNHETFHIQALPLQQQQPRFHDCGHGPNLVSGGSFNFQQQQYSTGSGTSIAQSIPLAEQDTKFITGPATSYGPPPSGGNEFDHIGYASEKSQVTAFPDATNSNSFPGLDGLNALSAQKSQAIHLSSQETKNDETYQIQFDSSDQQQTANHEEILSAGLLQTILNAVEQPQPQHQPLPANHKAESRSDIDINEEAIEEEDEIKPDVEVQESKNFEVKLQPDDEKSQGTDLQEIKPIVVKEENEAKH